MYLFENISLAISALRAGKMRAMLTMLGIIIGIGSVIAIATVGNSLTSSLTSSMEEMGANTIQVYVNTRESNVNRMPAASDLITEDMATGLSTYLGDAAQAVLISEGAGSGQVKDGHRYANVSITGTSAGYITAANTEILMGHDINEREVKGSKYVAVVSSKLVERIFPNVSNPLGQEIKVDAGNLGWITFTIVGVYEYKIPAFLASFVQEDDISTDLYIPYTTAKRIIGADPGFDFLYVLFKPGDDSSAIVDRIEEYFEKLYRNNSNFTVYAYSNEGILSQMTTLMSTVSLGIAFIAGISLMVGGIGVMNIMLVSVTERTREIGTRKALGARNSAIRAQFIIESMIICLIGGLIGIITGLGLGFLITSLMKFPASPSIAVIVIAVLFSMAIGVFFGFYPANKAAKLDPIEALRYE